MQPRHGSWPKPEEAFKIITAPAGPTYYRGELVAKLMSGGGYPSAPALQVVMEGKAAVERVAALENLLEALELLHQ